MTSTSQPKHVTPKGPFPGPIGFEHDPENDPVFDGAGFELEDPPTAQAIAILALYLGVLVGGVVALRRISRQLRGRQAKA